MTKLHVMTNQVEMAQPITLSVEWSKATKNGSFHTKLVYEIEAITPFGPVKRKKVYYTFTAVEQAVGFTATIDLAHYDVVQGEYFPDGQVNAETGQVNEAIKCETLRYKFALSPEQIEDIRIPGVSDPSTYRV